MFGDGCDGLHAAVGSEAGDAPGASLDLQAENGGQPFGFPGGEPGTTGEFGSLLNNTTFEVLHIEVAAETAALRPK